MIHTIIMNVTMWHVACGISALINILTKLLSYNCYLLTISDCDISRLWTHTLGPWQNNVSDT
jgi:hypothetical protein